MATAYRDGGTKAIHMLIHYLSLISSHSLSAIYIYIYMQIKRVIHTKRSEELDAADWCGLCGGEADSLRSSLFFLAGI